MKRASALLLMLASAATADTVYLTNGNSLVGKIEDVNADPIVLVVKGGKISIELTEIQEMAINEQGTDGVVAVPGEEEPGEAPATGEGEQPQEGVQGPSVADLPPPKDETERARRYDLVMTQLNKVTMHREEATQEELDREEDYTRALGQLGPSVAPAIEDTFRNGSVRSAGAMLRALRLADPARAEAVAAEAIEHAHPEARQQAIEILAASSQPDKAGLLARALDDPRGVNRLAALQALATTKDEKAAPEVLKLASDADPAVQAEAIKTLQAMTGQQLTTAAEWQEWVAKSSATVPSETLATPSR